MRKLALATAAAIAAFSAPAMAASQNWNVTEENTSGVKHGQGTWAVTIDGDKLSGSRSWQLDNGNPLTYSLEGTIKDGVYTVKLDKRSDDKRTVFGLATPGPLRPQGSRLAMSAIWFATAPSWSFARSACRFRRDAHFASVRPHGREPRP